MNFCTNVPGAKCRQKIFVLFGKIDPTQPEGGRGSGTPSRSAGERVRTPYPALNAKVGRGGGKNGPPKRPWEAITPVALRTTALHGPPLLPRGGQLGEGWAVVKNSGRSPPPPLPPPAPAPVAGGGAAAPGMGGPRRPAAPDAPDGTGTGTAATTGGSAGRPVLAPYAARPSSQWAHRGRGPDTGGGGHGRCRKKGV